MTPEKQVFVEMDAKELAAFKLGLEVAAKIVESRCTPRGKPLECPQPYAGIAAAIRYRAMLAASPSVSVGE
jgi:hypothetical protein